MTVNKGYDEKLVEELKELDALSLEMLHPAENRGNITELGSHRVAWKGASHNTILRLIIPEGARVVFPKKFGKATRKIRTTCAFVDEIKCVLHGSITSSDRTQVRSIYSESFVYRENDIVFPQYFDESIDIVCTDGIHIFARRDQAKRFLPHA